MNSDDIYIYIYIKYIYIYICLFVCFFPPKGEAGDSVPPPQKKKKTVIEPSAKGEACKY